MIQRSAVVAGTAAAMHSEVTLTPAILGARGGEVEQDVPRRIGEQLAVEIAAAQAALADDLVDQPGIGQRHAQPPRHPELIVAAIADARRSEPRSHLTRLVFARGNNQAVEFFRQPPDLLRQV